MSDIKCISCNKLMGIGQVALSMPWPGNYVISECDVCGHTIYHCYDCYYPDKIVTDDKRFLFNRTKTCKNCERDKKIETLYEL